MLPSRNCSSADLTRNLKSADAAESAALRETLIVDFATPLVRQTVKRRFASARFATPQDVEDVCADAMCAVIVRLQRHCEGGPEIVDFENYAASVASNTADRFFAARAPQRARLRNRIRYVLTTDTRFVISESGSGVWLCALQDSPRNALPLGGEAFERTGREGRLQCDENTSAAAARSESVVRSVSVEECRRRLAVSKLAAGRLPQLISEILSAAQGPLELSDLTTFAANAMGITDRIESVDDHADLLRDPAVPFANTAELKDWLKRLWEEVCQLPLLQRFALLLNLGSGGNTGAGATLCAITDLGIATFSALAASLEMTARDLAGIWNRVPLPDNEIATFLKLERQQVINLRASARQRLTRRMNALDKSRSAVDKSVSHTKTASNSDTTGFSR